MNQAAKPTSLLRRALFYAWLFYSAFGLLAVLATLTLPDNVIFENSPKCYSVKRFGRECFMCGSTRGFTALGNGQLKQAWAFNKLSVFLYAGIVINTIIVLLTTLTIIKKQRKL